MGSINAFAGEPSYMPTNGVDKDEDTARQPKRLRLSSEDVYAALENRCAQDETSLEVDHMILDYVAFSTIKACLASRSSDSRSGSAASLSANLSMTDSFMSIFKARHPAYRADPELKFRIKLLKFVTLFTQRLTYNPTTPDDESLEALREHNKDRVWDWIERTNRLPSAGFDTSALEQELPASDAELERNRKHVLRELDIPAEDDESQETAFYGTSSCVSLLDILPLFMEVSAARNAMNASTLSEHLMHMACEFMLQACLEQYLIIGSDGSNAVDEAFAWGYDPSSGDDDDEVNDMFEDEENAVEAENWAKIKTSYLQRLLQMPHGIDEYEEDGTNARLLRHWENVATKYPISSFETAIFDYLTALSDSIPGPVLAQLESGKLDGMTEQETQEFLADCGVDMAGIFGD